MKNVQVKTSEEMEKRFNSLFEKSGTNTKSEFLEKLLNSFENPSEPTAEADQKLIKELTLQVEEKNAVITQLETDKNEHEQKLQFIQERMTETALPEGAIVLNFEPEFREYFWAVNEICKKMKYSETYEQLIQNVFTVCYKRGELVLSKEDCDYIETLKEQLKKGNDGQS
jgi:hypothetical protein